MSPVHITLVFLWLASVFPSPSSAQERLLWGAAPETPDELRHLNAEISEALAPASLRLTASAATRQNYAWATITAPQAEGIWNLAPFRTVEATLSNRGSKPADAMLWAVGRRGWSAVGDFAELQPGESRRFVIDLRQSYPDGTPKVDPSQIKQVQVMFRHVDPGLDVAVSDLTTAGSGEAPPWVRPPARLKIPELEAGPPRPGRRVRLRLSGDESSPIYCVLYLPKEWVKGANFPVIAEFPGNIFFNAKCYSTGRPEQCAIGYGMSKGSGAIVLSLPFVDRGLGAIVENGFGNADDTTDYALRAVETVIRDFGADRQRLILTGFSRGSIACGYIGLRNNKIAALWKGIHGCQHYDGSKWHQSNLADAVQRAPRFRGQAIFQTDNSKEKYQPVVDATRPEVEWTWVKSGLGFHSTAMFLDDRPSTLRLREWYRGLVGEQ